MATTTLGGNPVNTVGELPVVGSKAPSFSLVSSDMADVTLAGLAGQRVILNIFPSIDTGVCATSTRKFNELATGLANTQVVCVSADLPFALNRFCGAEGITNIVTASTFRSSFGDDYGVKMAEGRLAALMARSVVVIDEAGKVVYTQLTDSIGDEPNYDAAIAALA